VHEFIGVIMFYGPGDQYEVRYKDIKWSDKVSVHTMRYLASFKGEWPSRWGTNR
jgi:hypothetical protein